MAGDPELTRLTRLAAQVCGAPIAVLTLADGRNHYLKSVFGVELAEPTRLLAFCVHTAQLKQRFMVADALADPLFASEPVVAEAPHVRFYLGVPMLLQDGTLVGTLAVMDTVARALDAGQAEGLETLAEQAMAQLELRRHRHVLAGLSAERERMNLMLARQTGHFIEMAGRSAQLGGWEMELPSRRVLWSDEVAAIYGQPKGSLLEFEQVIGLCVPVYRDKVKHAFDDCALQGTPFDIEIEVITAKGLWRWVRTFGQAVRNGEGAITAIQGATQDVTKNRRAEEDAQRLATRLSDTLESITDAFFTLDNDWCFTYLNREAERLLARKRDELFGQPVWPEFRRSAESAMASSAGGPLERDTLVEFEQFYLPTGLWFKVRAYPSSDGLAVYVRDVTERHKSQEQLELLELSVSRLNDLVLITEAGEGGASDQRIVFVNDAFARRTGFEREEMMGRTSSILQGPKTQRDELDRVSAALKANEPVRAELINYKKGGEEFWIELDMVPVADKAGLVKHWVTVGRDITQRKAAEQAIQQLAFYDALTQLPNRLVLMDRLKAALSVGPERQDRGALMFIDLDNFKTLNDTAGHDKGDLLLQQVAARLTAAVRKTDTVARLGGDEFVVMLSSLGPDPERAEASARVAAEKILAALAMPYMLAGFEHHSTSSIGVTSFTGHHGSVGELLKQADLAMYQAKTAGRNTVCFFNPEMQAAVTVHAALSSDMRHSLREQHFVVHYQPQVDREGRMSGAEALVRWMHPQRGLMEPTDFIPIAEDTGMVLPLGQWVLETACQQLATWSLRPETAHLTIAVNVSVRQFRHPEFVDMVIAAIRKTAIKPELLELELTETLLAQDMEVTIAKMATLKDMGVTLTVDDFGMGYSSLSSLKRIPLDKLKIDKDFVRDILRDPNDAAIARAIIAMAQSLGLGLLAEGVENEAQREFLARQGCHRYQGFLFCGPLPIEELEEFMLSLEKSADVSALTAAGRDLMRSVPT